MSQGEDEVFAELRAGILDPGVSLTQVADLLDRLEGPVREPVIRRLGKRAQRTLYAKAKGHGALRLSDLVAPDCADLEEVRHLGRNTLPAFRIFEKRFCRLPGADPDADDAVAGYNFQTMAPVTGPGYFLARNDPDQAEVLVDYGRLPAQRPPHWPEIRSNEKGLGRLVYGFMVDRLRRVSEHVSVGSAARNGRDLGSYFVLSRYDPPA